MKSNNSYWKKQKIEGKVWQEIRYKEGRKVWGEDPGPTVPIALNYFLERDLSRILVIGCGYGRECFYLARNGLNVTGVDASEEGIKIAREWKSKEEILSARFEIGDALNLHFTDNSFDGVFTHKVFHQFNFDDRKKMMDEIYRVLCPGGIFLLSDLSTSDPEYGNGIEIEFNTFERPHRPFRPIYFLSKDHLTEFKKFSLISVDERDHWEIHPGEDTEHQHYFLQIIGEKI